MSTSDRLEEGGLGALLTGVGFSLAGTVEKAGAPWAMNALAALGLGAGVSTVLVATAGATSAGFGIYKLVRALVGTDPTSSWRMGLPGFVSGGILTAVGVQGLIQLAFTGAAIGAGLPLALAATSIIAAVGVGFLAYGGYQAWKARQTRLAAPEGANVPRSAVTRPVAGSVAPSGASTGARASAGTAR